ncbi:MAG: hypothetical protein COB67_05870 [SAR324 cluster bacterium]|uniref:Lipoprotein n=1 Tax=SAR324 cluster bacterium TaxID=2024889 RepID=A0A2A4T543_9DELT|nr:MAG: hypothetical protein COB67_05870 [SAR324 cluster bacterium]
MKRIILNLLALSLVFLLSGCTLLSKVQSGDASNANKEISWLNDVAIKAPINMDKEKTYIVVYQPFKYQLSLFEADQNNSLKLVAYNEGGTDSIAIFEISQGLHTYILDACFPATITVDAKNGYAYYITKAQAFTKQSFSQYCSGQGKLLLADDSPEKVKEYLCYDNYVLNPKMKNTVQNEINNSSLPAHWKERNKIIDEVKPIFNVFVKSDEGVKLD